MIDTLEPFQYLEKTRSHRSGHFTFLILKWRVPDVLLSRSVWEPSTARASHTSRLQTTSVYTPPLNLLFLTEYHPPPTRQTKPPSKYVKVIVLSSLQVFSLTERVPVGRSDTVSV